MQIIESAVISTSYQAVATPFIGHVSSDQVIHLLSPFVFHSNHFLQLVTKEIKNMKPDHMEKI